MNNKQYVVWGVTAGGFWNKIATVSSERYALEIGAQEARKWPRLEIVEQAPYRGVYEPQRVIYTKEGGLQPSFFYEELGLDKAGETCYNRVEIKSKEEEEMSDVNEFLRDNIEYIGLAGGVWRPRLECRDGFSMSVQASSFHYSYPKIDETPFYLRVEVGYPSEPEELLSEWEEEGSKGGIFGFVPVDVINRVIQKHGGIKEASAKEEQPEELGKMSFEIG